MPESQLAFLHADLLTTQTHLPKFKTRYTIWKKFGALERLRDYLDEPASWKLNITIRRGHSDDTLHEFFVGLTAQYKEPAYGIAGANYAKLMRLVIDERENVRRWGPFTHQIESDIERAICNLGLDFLKETGIANIGLLSDRGRSDFQMLRPPEDPPEELEYDYEEEDDYDWVPDDED